MPTPYRLGLSIVSLAIALGASLTILLPHPTPRPAGEDLGDFALPIGSFRLTERAGRAVTDSDLAGRVWIAAFAFTRCPTSCPRLAAHMKGLQEELAARPDVRLVTISVDPENDTPAVLSNYAKTLAADPDRWWFLTGPKADVYSLILDRFKLDVAETGLSDREAGRQGIEKVRHSTRLALVDRGNRLVGFFDSEDPDALRNLLARARRLDSSSRLPAVNATLNGTCALLLIAGWALIRSGRVRAHSSCMIAGVVVSALFLGCYLVYHYQVGSMPFRGSGPARFLYFTILISHTVLAVTMLPLIGLTLARAIRGDFPRHARVARVTYPIWLYVSITGVVIYLMLYQLPVSMSSALG